MSPSTLIDRFLAEPAFAVVGASNDPAKFGYRVFAAYLRHGRRVFPVNPRESRIQDHPAWPALGALPERVRAVSVITPPSVTERIVEEAAAAGVTMLWLQSGAESPHALLRARELGIETIAGGPCLLVEIDRLPE